MSSRPNYYALLIGINAYTDNPLWGSVNSVRVIKEALSQQQSPPVEFRILTATRTASGGLAESEEDRPTSKNVLAALKEFIGKVKEGDFVYFHYSGHGQGYLDGMPSDPKQIRPERNFSLLLLDDAHQGETRDFPGSLMKNLLQELSEGKHANVTVVLDFAGWVNTSIQHDELVGSKEEDKLDNVGSPGWLSNPHNYAVLVSDERSVESLVEGQYFGLLTYLIHEFLIHYGLGRKHTDLFAYLLRKYEEFPTNSRQRRPILVLGDSDQVIFGTSSATALVLNAGEVHGFCVGDKFFLHPPQNTTYDKSTTFREPISATITQLNALTSILSGNDLDTTEGWTAEPQSLLRLREFPVYLDPAIANPDTLRNTLSRHSLRVLSEATQPYQFHVKLVTDDNPETRNLHIIDSSGKTIDIGQELRSDTDAESLAGILTHLAKYTLHMRLFNKRPLSEQQESDSRMLFSVHAQVESIRCEPNQLIEIEDGQIVEFFLENKSSITLYACGIVLSSGFNIQSLFSSDSGLQARIEPRGTFELESRVFVPKELRGVLHCDDFLKIIVTTKPTNFSILHQPRPRSVQGRVSFPTSSNRNLLSTTQPQHPMFDSPDEKYSVFHFHFRVFKKHESKSGPGTTGAVSFPGSDEHTSNNWPRPYSSYNSASTMPSSISEEADTGMTTDNIPSRKQGDIQSLKSVDDDIDSRAESSSWAENYLEMAVNFVVHQFTQDPELLALYQEAIASMDALKFVRNHRRLLKTYFMDLQYRGGSSPSQEVAIRFFRSRSKRVQISSKIHSVLMPLDDSIRDKIELLAKDNEYTLSRYLENLDFPPGPIQAIDWNGQSNAENESGTESEGSTDEDEAEEQNTLSKLEATGEFLTAGSPFARFKRSFREFIQPISAAPDKENRALDDDEGNGYQRAEVDKVEYSVALARVFRISLSDFFKRAIDSLAGRPLAWWPLSNPEDVLRSDHTRVYSTPSEQPSHQFYDDIPTSLAEKLFPMLLNPSLPVRGWRYKTPSHSAVFLRDTTLMRVLQGWRNSTGGNHQQRQQAGQSANLSSQPTQNDRPSSPRQHSQAQDAVELKEEDTADQDEESIVFMSADMRPNESIACTVDLGANDQTTFQNLQLAHRKFPSWGWKRATGIKFYRFRSFHFKESLKRHHVDIDKDRERYPLKDEPEYHSYKYEPSPWQDGTPCPCLSGEAWYFFQHPDECGTSRLLNDTLPVRRHGTTDSRFTAWGLYIEQRHSVLAIFILTLAMIVATLSATLWFVKPWLEDHPGDLQNATVPVIVAVTTLSMLLQLLTSLLAFRWSV